MTDVTVNLNKLSTVSYVTYYSVLPVINTTIVFQQLPHTASSVKDVTFELGYGTIISILGAFTSSTSIKNFNITSFINISSLTAPKLKTNDRPPGSSIDISQTLGIRTKNFDEKDLIVKRYTQLASSLNDMTTIERQIFARNVIDNLDKTDIKLVMSTLINNYNTKPKLSDRTAKTIITKRL